jgi:hypothetical protein
MKGDMKMRLALLALLIAGCAPGPASAQTAVDVAPFDAFNAVDLRAGGRVVVRHGAAPSVRVVEGDPGTVRLTVENGRLRIERCRECRHDRGLRLEVVAPALTGLSIENGGTIALDGRFPDQAELAVAVAHGGRIDARALGAETVRASVSNGGHILTLPRRRLDAAVSQGGMIVYWGTPAVSPAIAGGGGVVRGRPGDIHGPVAEIGDVVQPPPLPPKPPAPPMPAGELD